MNAKLAYFAGTPVVLATPTVGDGWLAQRLNKFGDGPVAALIGTAKWKAAAKTYPLSGETVWFGKSVAWFDQAKLHDLKIGIISTVQ